ncbi:type II toxin-antitoxin system RelE/ParE family toxin [Zooshikella ganghwensis]|uniref:type II toxin-antitoxin system RelE/ParE family toxin n=1 Tax=Zooshikella ganghwensis TaxID=202772 RepID=UPI001E2E015E|nr:type II toxin-antitoxin system RelE/ParE family toxin [Zooshikella ganghwensis]
MRIFKAKHFNKWARKEGLKDEALKKAVTEIEQGLVDADLGGNVFKKRVPIAGKGKSGGLRTLLAYKVDDKAFFIYGVCQKCKG